MTEINKNIKKVKTPPIDYFNNLLKYKSNTNIPQISFGHGIPMHTPVDYHTFKNNILLESSSYKYTEIKGKYDIRKFISKKIDSKTSFDVTPDNFIITSGANSALFKSLFLHLDEGDQIMIPSPVYFNHAMAIEMIGGVVVEVNTKPNNGFQLDIDNIISNINDKTKSIIINSPNNPTGAIYDTNDIKKLSEICIKNDLTLILDYTYDDFVYESNYNPLSEFSDFENLILVGSFSKTFGITGLRLGYICASSDLIDDLSKIQDTISICAPAISQNILLELINNSNNAVQKNFVAASNSRTKLINVLQKSEYLNWENTNGAFYAFVELKTINDTWKFCEDLIVNKSILALPGTIFGDQWGSYLRIAYGSVTPDEIEEGIQRIEEFISHTT